MEARLSLTSKMAVCVSPGTAKGPGETFVYDKQQDHEQPSAKILGFWKAIHGYGPTGPLHQSPHGLKYHGGLKLPVKPPGNPSRGGIEPGAARVANAGCSWYRFKQRWRRYGP